MNTTKEYYQKIWDLKKIPKINRKDAYKKEEPDIELKKFLSFLNKKRVSGKVLDIGCGAGRHSILFSKNGFDVTGFDYSSNAIKLAKKLAERLRTKINFKVSDVLNYKEKKIYDAIIDYGCLHHLNEKNWKKYLKTIQSISKRDSYLFLFVFSKNMKRFQGNIIKNNQKNIIVNGEYSHFFSISEIRKLFSKSFRIEYFREKKTIDRFRSCYIFYMKRIK